MPFSQLEPKLSSFLHQLGCVTNTKLGFSACCKNRGSSIGESCEEGHGFSGTEPLVEPVVFVFVAAEAIDDEEKEFSQKTKCFPEKTEKKLKRKQKKKP